MPITPVTRQAIQDCLLSRPDKWWGRLSQIGFLSRLYNLRTMPSSDDRYQDAAADLHCHTVRFPDDWEWDWIFTDERFEFEWKDEKFLAFLAEVLHPVVRPDTEEALRLAEEFNTHLAVDGWSLRQVDTMSDRPIFGPVRNGGHLNSVVPVDELSSPYVQRQLERMNSSIDADPELAMGAAKELLETTCKTILGRRNCEIPGELPGLVRSTLDELGLDLSGAEDPERAAGAFRRLRGNLSGLGAAIGEVRNAVGTGHGRDASAGHVSSMYARLTANATATLVTFMLDRYQQSVGTTPVQVAGSADV